MYDNTYDPEKAGITKLKFFTADELCIFRYNDYEGYTDEIGLTVYAERELRDDTRYLEIGCGDDGTLDGAYIDNDFEYISTVFCGNEE